MTVTPADDLARLLRAVAPKLRRLADIDNELGWAARRERDLADDCDIYADQLTDAGAFIVCPDDPGADVVDPDERDRDMADYIESCRDEEMRT